MQPPDSAAEKLQGIFPFLSFFNLFILIVAEILKEIAILKEKHKNEIAELNETYTREILNEIAKLKESHAELMEQLHQKILQIQLQSGGMMPL